MAARTGVAPSAIRFYERAGLLDPPFRTGAAYRSYGEADLHHLRVIVAARAVGIPLPELRELLDHVRAGTLRAQAERLVGPHVRRFLAEMEGARARLSELFQLLDLPAAAVDEGRTPCPGDLPIPSGARGLIHRREELQVEGASHTIVTAHDVEDGRLGSLLVRLVDGRVETFEPVQGQPPGRALARLYALRRWADRVEALGDGARVRGTVPQIAATMQLDAVGNSVLRVDGEDFSWRFWHDRPAGVIRYEAGPTPFPWPTFVLLLDLGIRFLEPIVQASERR